MKAQKELYKKAKKITKIYNIIGFILFILIILSSILSIWIINFWKVLLSIIILFISIVILYRIGPRETITKIDRTGYKDESE